MEQKKKSTWKVSKSTYVLLLPALFLAGVLVGNKVDIKTLIHRSLASQNAKTDLDYSSVTEAYDALIQNYDGKLDNAKLLDGLKKGLAEATEDPYTEYFPAEDSKSFKEEISGSFVGIGAELGKENNAIVIVSPLKGFPAEKAGVLAKDIILKIDDQDATSLTIGDAVKKIRGPKDTTVKLTLLRGSQQVEISIVRADIKIPSVEFSVLDGGVCSINISRFSDDTYTIVSQAAKECKSKGASKVLVDLRNNPGGYLEQAIRVASHWVPTGKNIVSEKRGGQVIKTHPAVIGQEFVGMKTVVLINEGSASASEILSGALKDYGLATLVGQKSYGKGSVQEVDPLTGGTSIKITIARWYTPNDKNIDKQGIEPDQKVDISVDQIKAGEDPQKAKALELLAS
jgi:carboxyl-terminal processing protease